MGCATWIIKCLVCIWNVLIGLLGIVTILANALALKNATPDMELNLNLMIPVGFALLVVSFFGCIGTVLQNTRILWTYAVFVLIILLGHLTILLAYSSDLDAIERALQLVGDTWQQMLDGTGSMNNLQQEHYCCGKNSSQDYIDANLTIPASCYHVADMGILYLRGCLYKVMQYFENFDELMSNFSWTLFSVVCVTFICACILAETFGKKQRRPREGYSVEMK